MPVKKQKVRKKTNSSLFTKQKLLLLLTVATLLSITLTSGHVNNILRFRTQAQTVPSSFVFTAAGDHGQSTKASALAGMDVVAQSGSDFYLALGDLSYSVADEQAWCGAFKSRFNDVEIIAGNHDTGENTGGNIDTYITYCPYTLTGLSGDYGKQYYFDYPQTGTPLARFILISPGIKGSMNIDYAPGGAGYVFTENAINDARAKGIKWLIVGMHKNCISMGQKSCEIGSSLMSLLLNSKVDLILQSHDHNYQRSHGVSCITQNTVNPSCITDDGSDGTYVKGNGSVILINGEFGMSHYAVNASDTEAGYFAKFDDTTFGITKYTVSETQIAAQYLQSSGPGFADAFTIIDTSTPTATPDPNVPTPTPTLGITTTTINPIADASTKADQPSVNFGTATTLESDGSPVYVAYMKYDLSAFAGKTLLSAKLRMRVADASTSTQNIKSVSDTTWTETGITYTNRPTSGSTITTFPGGTLNTWVETDITSGISGKLGQQVSLAVDSTGTDGFDFYSKESSTNKVELVLTTQSVDMATPTPTETVVIPTATPTLIPTATPVPTATPTFTPTPTSLPAQTFYPTADSFVGSDFPTRNNGTSAKLESDGSPKKIVYMKYDLSSLTGKQLKSAKLRMKVLDTSVGTQNIRLVSNISWTETGITYNNRPALGSTLKTFSGGTTGNVVEVDITSGLATSLGKVITIAIESTNADGYDFASRTNSVVNDRVRLLLTVQ